MGINIPWFKKPATPITPEKQEAAQTAFSLYSNNQFLDFADAAEAAGSWSRPQKLDLDSPLEPSNPDHAALLALYGRFQAQTKVADSVVKQLEGQFASVAGGNVDRNHLLKSKVPFTTRFANYASNLVLSMDGLPPELAEGIWTKVRAIDPTFIIFEDEEDTIASEMNAEIEKTKNSVLKMKTEADRLKTETKFKEMKVANPNDPALVQAKMTEMLTAIDAFTLDAEIESIDPLAAEFRVYKTNLRTEVERLSVSGQPDYQKVLTDTDKTLQKTHITDYTEPLKKALNLVSTDTTSILLAKESVGSRLDGMRKTIMESAASQHSDFDQLHEQVVKLQAEQDKAKALRSQVQKFKIENPEQLDKKQRLHDNLEELNKFGRRSVVGRAFSTVFSASYRKAKGNVENLMGTKTLPSDMNKTIEDLRKQLAIPGQLATATAELQKMNGEIRSGLPIVTDLAVTFTQLAQNRLNENITKANSQEQIDKVRQQLDVMQLNGLVGENIDVAVLMDDMNKRAEVLLEEHLMTALDNASGNLNLTGLKNAIDRVADRNGGIGSADTKKKAYGLVVTKLQELMTNGKVVGKRAQDLAQALLDTMNIRYAQMA